MGKYPKDLEKLAESILTSRKKREKAKPASVFDGLDFNEAEQATYQAQVKEFLRLRPGPTFTIRYEDYLPREEEVKPVTVTKPILWRSPEGQYVVVEGPFPSNFTRCMTRQTVKAAAAIAPYDPVSGLMRRDGTSNDKAYALTLAEYVKQTHNEFGEIAP